MLDLLKSMINILINVHNINDFTEFKTYWYW